MEKNNKRQFVCGEHDHQRCIAEALARAEEVCRKRNQRFTRLRRRVFELVWQQHKPVRAYDVLEQLQQDGRAAPPTVYRTLDFLLEFGLIHRIESLNAYVGCIHPGRQHEGQFLICKSCNAFAELDSEQILAAIAHDARRSGFEVQQQTIEIMGLCPDCQVKKENR